MLLIAVMVTVCSATARPVDQQRARQLVESHFFSPALCVSPDTWTELYVFVPAEGAGFVIVSADDCTRPVLGYSMTTSFSIEGMPAHVASWIDGYRREISELRKVGATASAAVEAMWASPKSGIQQAVEPLMTTTWNQAPWYNAMCPYSAEADARAVTGCTATAQAQLMKYWNHPAKGHGRHFYNCSFGGIAVDFDTLYAWDSMPDALGWGSSETQIHAVAQLMYHVGVSVEMNYGVGSSSAFVIAYGSYNIPSSERSLREHFRYSPLLHGERKIYYSDADWDSLLRNEIVHRRPVLYSGYDSAGGHAFVLDGYDTLGMFHVNWGWGGYYDGYYTTDSLSPGAGGIGGNATYTFNLDNAAIFGVQPSYGDDSLAVVNVVSLDTLMGTVSGNGTYLAYEDTVFIMATAAPGYRFAGWKSGITTNPVQLVLNGDYIDTALFLPVTGDTLSYCGEHYYTGWQDDYGSSTEWGIRVPASLHEPLRKLEAVQLFIAAQGYYTMNVYVGDAINSNNLVCTKQYNLSESPTGWNTLVLDSSVSLYGNDVLWITFRFSGYNTFPATSTYYTGVSDGCWYKMPLGWTPFDQQGVYLTWMIRAIFSERLCHVAIENAGNCELDSFSGAGDYALGEIVTVSVSDPDFLRWEGIATTDTAITFTVVGDTTFRALCNAVGISEVEDVTSDQPVVIYDLMGRKVATRRDELQSLPAGVYLLRAGERTTKKIVIL